MINYISEHSGIALAGKTAIVIAIFSALLSLIFYLISSKNEKFKLAGKLSYLLHFASVLTAGFLLYIAIFNHYYEFSYVWKHSANNLQTKFLISAFWAGQEGSFLLWVFFQGLLGTILLFTAKRWESGVMAVIAGGQFLLSTMVWGIKPLGMVIGQSPFMLLREQAENLGQEFFKNPNYPSLILDGNGINPLLENYWMVIHPPVLFIGYAAAIIPFAFALASLFRKEFDSWLRPAFPWTIFAVLSLGTGILLGGAWAYESLTFGGFWAWDPVENASLIPWLILLGAMHMMILNRKRQQYYGMSFILVIFGFFFVVYASYLTRSGVLGATSVHAFGNNGLSAQMVVMMAVTLIISLWAYIKNFRNFPKNKQEFVMSREFWMFIGTIVLILSAFQVFITTSVPVFNKIFSLDIAPPLDVVGFYNKWQLPFGLLTVFTIGVSMILKYGKNNSIQFFKSMIFPLAASILLFIGEIILFQISSLTLLLFLFLSTFSLVSAVAYLIKNRKNLYILSNTFAHLGFSLFMIGVIVAFSQSKIISRNTSQYNLGEGSENTENQLLIKGEMKEMGEFTAVYSKKEKQGKRMIYSVDFYSIDSRGNKEKAFTVEPSINANMMMGNVYDPDTRHELKHDVFTYISYADIMSDFMGVDSKTLVEQEIEIKDTLLKIPVIAVLDTIIAKGKDGNMSAENITITAFLNIIDSRGNSKKIDVSYIVENGSLSKKDCLLEEEKLNFKFVGLSQKPMTVKLAVDEKRMDFIVVKTIVFPWISLVWIGAFIMLSGLILSLWRNTKLSHKE